MVEERSWDGKRKGGGLDKPGGPERNFPGGPRLQRAKRVYRTFFPQASPPETATACGSTETLHPGAFAAEAGISFSNFRRPSPQPILWFCGFVPHRSD